MFFLNMCFVFVSCGVGVVREGMERVKKCTSRGCRSVNDNKKEVGARQCNRGSRKPLSYCYGCSTYCCEARQPCVFVSEGREEGAVVRCVGSAT